MTAPSIACLGVIGKNNNPLHITIFPSYNPLPSDGRSFNVPLKTPLQYSLLLSSCLDIFVARTSSSAPGSQQGSGRNKLVLNGEYGLLTTVDERLSVYGFCTNTGTKFIVVVDGRGRRLEAMPDDGVVVAGRKASLGVREMDVKIVFKAMHVAYIRLLQNPFYTPDEHCPPTGRGGKKISNRRFAADIKTIGEMWQVGVTSL